MPVIRGYRRNTLIECSSAAIPASSRPKLFTRFAAPIGVPISLGGEFAMGGFVT